MKIKFIKKYVAFHDFEGAFGTSTTYEVGTTKNVSTKPAQWLINNGFAEEVKESGWWKPKRGDKYWYIGLDNFVHLGTWENSVADNGMLKLGLIFKTEKASVYFRDYLEAVVTVKQDEGVIDLQGIGEEYETAPENKYDDFSVYTVAFSLYLRKLVVIDADEYISANAIWFDTEEHAQSSLDNHPDEWKIIVNYDWGRETEYVYKERHAELSNNGKEGK